MGGSTTPQSQTTTVDNTGRQELQQLAMPFLEKFAANPPQLPKTSLVAGFDPAQQQGQNMALDAAGGAQTDLANIGKRGAQFLSGDVLYPSTNPALAENIRTATLPIAQNLTENALPAIRREATNAGQFGSSRQGIAEGLASGRASQAQGAVAADLANRGYTSGLNAFVQNLGLLPATQQTQLMPALTTSGVGDVRQALTQAMLGESATRETYPQLLPLLMGQSIAGVGSAFAPSGATTTASTPQSNPTLQGAGLGISAAANLLPLFL